MSAGSRPSIRRTAYLLDEARAGRARRCWSPSPTSRPRAAAGSGGRGSRRPAHRCSCRCCCGRDLPPESLALVTMAAGLAAIDAVRDLGGIDAGLKWPNDVVVDDRKLAGILAEKDGRRGRGRHGPERAWETFPDELAAIATACNLLRRAFDRATSCSSRGCARFDDAARRARSGDRRGERPLGDARAPRASRARRRVVRGRRDRRSRTTDISSCAQTTDRRRRSPPADVVHLRVRTA